MFPTELPTPPVIVVDFLDIFRKLTFHTRHSRGLRGGWEIRKQKIAVEIVCNCFKVPKESSAR